MGSFWHQNFAIWTSKITYDTARGATLATCGGKWCSLECLFQCIFCTSAVIGRCVASYVIKLERLVFHFALLSLLAMPLTAFLHEIHNVIVIPTPLLTLCYGWRVGFVQANDNM